jgi:ornithine cyclodeaminase/alanine dehydrogenase-like protein (mu-crystallin family)
MTLLLTESNILELLEIKEVIKEVERAFVEQSLGKVNNFPRTRTYTESSVFNVMHASLSYIKRAGLKCYISTKKGIKFVILLFDTDTSELLAVMAAEAIGKYRTGAASAVATKYLYGKRGFSFALIGSGGQAITQLLAMHQEFKPEKVKAWSPTKKNLLSFVERAAREGFEVTPASSIEEACLDADVITTITSSKEPFLSKEHIRDAAHINACGSNYPNRAEVMPECFPMFSTICVDSLEQSKIESGDFILASKKGMLKWEQVKELSQIIASAKEREGKTLFKSNGIAMEDVAVADLVYRKALKEKTYSEIELFKER